MKHNKNIDFVWEEGDYYILFYSREDPFEPKTNNIYMIESKSL